MSNHIANIATSKRLYIMADALLSLKRATTKQLQTYTKTCNVRTDIMNNRIIKLSAVIDLLKGRFPDFIYINSLTDNCPEQGLMDANYAVFVKGIPVDRMEEFSKFVFNNIYLQCDENEEMPMIVPIQCAAEEYVATQNCVQLQIGDFLSNDLENNMIWLAPRQPVPFIADNDYRCSLAA